MKKNILLSVAAGAAAAAASAIYYYSFTRWLPATYGLSVVLYALSAGCLCARFAKKKPLLRGVAAGAAFGAAFFALTFLINNVLLHEVNAVLAARIVCCLTLAFFLVFYFVLSWKKQKNRLIAALAFALSVAMTAGSMAQGVNLHRAADPVGFGTFTPAALPPAENADLYVAPDGDDAADGSFDSPLATPEKARALVRGMDKTDRDGITVALKAGEYSLRRLAFTAEDGGTESCPVTYRAYGDGEVVLNGGLTLDASDFSPVTDETTLARLSGGAKKRVVCADLTALGLTPADWGKLYSVGGYTSAAHYDGDTTGPVPCVLYFNGAPMTTARYPDTGTLKVKTVIREGEGKENSKSNHAQRADWDTLRNPETTVFTADKKTAGRIAGYASLKDVWLWTALIYNWADGTAPLKSFDPATGAVEPAYVSVYGAVPGGDYYIFNVLEELDSPGEWYLDRETGMVYLYPPAELRDARISLSLSTEDLITVADASHLRFEGLSVRGTRGDGFDVAGNDVRISGCTVSEVSGTGVRLVGTGNALTGCELAHIGASGAEISGGDRRTLTPGGSRVENCLIHDFSEVALTAGPGVSLNGVGNVCAHNEIFNGPQQAISYGGNNNLMEYNLMYDVALLSDDCSAVYCGRRWDCCGSVIRYNAMFGLGDRTHHPNGIYWDDGMAGQTAYGNLIVNSRQDGFAIGGGRDLTVTGNILINCETPVSYDDRARDGVLNGDSWFRHSKEDADLRQNLEAMPWQSDVWLQAYPYTADWSLDYTDTENPDFVPNPANSRVSGNLIVQYAGRLGNISSAVQRFSEISGNAVFKMNAMKKLFTDPENGDYTLRPDAPVFDELPGFEPIPLNEIGRY